MHALLLDFQVTRRRTARSHFVLLLLGLTAAALLGIHSVDVISRTNTLEQQKESLNRQLEPDRQAVPRSTLDAQRLRAETKQAHEVLAQLALPWGALFKDIESSPRDQVALLSIDPDHKKHLIRISGEAKDLSAMLSYITGLQKRHSLTDVYLQSHHVDEQSAEKPVRFVVVGSWVIHQ